MIAIQIAHLLSVAHPFQKRFWFLGAPRDAHEVESFGEAGTKTHDSHDEYTHSKYHCVSVIFTLLKQADRICIASR